MSARQLLPRIVRRVNACMNHRHGKVMKESVSIAALSTIKFWREGSRSIWATSYLAELGVWRRGEYTGGEVAGDNV